MSYKMDRSCIQPKTNYDPTTKIWSGTKAQTKYGPECSLGQVALEALSKNSEQIAQICYNNGKSYTNREIATLSIRVAQHLKSLSLEQCDVIGICASNSDFLAPLFFGAMLSGLTVSTLDPSFDKDGIKHIFSVTKPKVMFCDGGVYDKIKSSLEESNLTNRIYTMKDHIVGVPQITEFLKETGTEAGFKPDPLKYGYDQVGTILCSSGTTGLPKGVCVSHAVLMNWNVFDVNTDDKILCFSNLYWLSGILFLIIGTIRGATRVIVDQGFTPEVFFDILEKYKVTSVLTPPSQMALAAAHPKIKECDFSSLTKYYSGGSAVPYAVVQKIKPYLPNAQIKVGYGMSEIGSVISLGKATTHDSAGQLLNNFEVKIINIKGELLGPNERGEICMRSPFKWEGYYNNSEASTAIYDSDGWIHSGDVGYFDDHGNIHIVDRIKDIMKYNNFHFSPSEIEKTISELPGIAEVCVCGIPDIVSTFLPAAAIVKSSGSNLTGQQVYDYVAEKMAHFKQLRGGVYFVDELPKTPSGKCLRKKVTEICENVRYQMQKGNSGNAKNIPEHKNIICV